MRIRPGIFILIIVVFGVLFGGRYAGWFGGRPNEVPFSGDTPAKSAARSSDFPANPPVSLPAPLPMVDGSKPGASPNAPPAGQPTPLLSVAGSADSANLIGDWEQRIDDVLVGKEEENQKAKRLLDLLPHLPEAGQVEAAQHLSNLLPDEEYPALAQTLTNAHTPEAVLDVLMTDVLNRPNAVKLTTLLEVARTPDHPKAEEARDVLEVFVDENYGDNWVAWESAVTNWLKENPDE